MFTNKFSRWMSAALVVGTLTMVSVPTAFAASDERPGYSPASAAAPDTATHTLQPGQWDWYVFHTDSLNYAADMPQNATINVTLNEDGTGNFQIWNSDNLQQWTGGQSVTPVGQGTENKSDLKDPLHFWSGGFTVNGTFYIVVQNKGNQPLHYSLQISSQNVDFPSQLSVAAAS